MSSKLYSFNGFAGCVVQSRSRKTRTLVGVYHGLQSGIEADPDHPWVTVCEEHHTCVSHSSLRQAKQCAPDPLMWCDDCREKESQ